MVAVTRHVFCHHFHVPILIIVVPALMRVGAVPTVVVMVHPTYLFRSKQQQYSDLTVSDPL